MQKNVHESPTRHNIISSRKATDVTDSNTPLLGGNFINVPKTGPPSVARKFTEAILEPAQIVFAEATRVPSMPD